MKMELLLIFWRKVKNIAHFLEALLANIWYGFPSRSIKVIGVTGTDGKTTTSSLIYHILSTNGKKVSIISTVYAQVGKDVFDTGFHTTTPNSFMVQRLLRLAANQGDEYFILETTSHRLDQNSLWGTIFEACVVTNITHEHLDYHKTYENYVRAKLKLIKQSKIAFINAEDGSYRKIMSLKPGRKISSYGINCDADYKWDPSKVVKEITHFNRYNYLAAYTVCRHLGLSKAEIFQKLHTYGLPKGRLEKVYDRDFTVIVDFAHTPNAIYQVLQSIRQTHLCDIPERKLIHVFGSAGLRDHSKRKSMGTSSGAHADVVILTEEDYRTEDPYTICEQISEGLKEQGFKFIKSNLIYRNDKKKYTIITERDLAINKAINIVGKGDVIVITGKGHEMSLCRGKKEYPWNDIDYVKKVLTSD